MTGVGLHSGSPVQVTVRPAPANTGVVFVRTDLPKAVMIEAKSENVVCTALATTLGSEGVTLGTVEHVLSAIYALGVTNLFIDGTVQKSRSWTARPTIGWRPSLMLAWFTKKRPPKNW